MNATSLTAALAGRSVDRIEVTRAGILTIHFTNGTALSVHADRDRLKARLHAARNPHAETNQAARPTARQGEYLEYIRKYIDLFRRSPAESDIQKHFRVTAPSVNLMVKTLERRGFITRQRDWNGQVVPRSIRIVDPGQEEPRQGELGVL